MDVTLEVVPDMAAAIDHIHANGSGHTGEPGKGGQTRGWVVGA
jgi:hypothetical protein